MKIKGIHHIKLTVSDLNQSKVFYSKLPGFKVVAQHPDFIMFYNGSFYLGLTTHKGKAKGTFDEQKIGLDHVSFELGSKNDLDEAVKILENENIIHSEIEKLSNGTWILVFRDPDNIQLEFCYKSES